MRRAPPLGAVSLTLTLLAAGCIVPPPDYYRAKVVDRRTREPIPNAEAEVKRREQAGEPAKPEIVSLGPEGRLLLPCRRYLKWWRMDRAEIVFRAPGYVPGRTVAKPEDFDGSRRIFGLRPLPPGGGPQVEDLPEPEVIPPAAFSPYRSWEQGLIFLTPGARPLAHLDRTLLPSDLELRDPGGLHVSLVAVSLFSGEVSLNYLPLEEEGGREVEVIWLDAGLGGAVPLVESEEAPLVPAVRITVGPSLLYMDFERGGYDTGGFGLFGRVGLGLWEREARFGLEAFGDLHGWVGGDSHQIQAAWAATLGLNLFVRF